MFAILDLVEPEPMVAILDLMQTEPVYLFVFWANRIYVKFFSILHHPSSCTFRFRFTVSKLNNCNWYNLLVIVS